MSGLIKDTIDDEEAEEFRLLEQLEGVSRLDLTGTNFGDLAKLTAFFNLNELILDQNHLNDSHFESLPHLPRLKTLSLNKNRIKNLDHLLDILEVTCPSLTYLSLLGNPACPDQLTNNEVTDDDYRCYRLSVLYKIPRLYALDSAMFRNMDRQEAVRQGPFLKTVRPSTSDCPDLPFNEQPENFGPLPKVPLKSTQTSFSKNQQTYSGKSSEGNRFIRNRDL